MYRKSCSGSKQNELEICTTLPILSSSASLRFGVYLDENVLMVATEAVKGGSTRKWPKLKEIMLGHHASRTRPTRASPGHLQLHEAQQGTGHNISFLFTISLRYCGLGSGVLLTDERYRTIEFAKKEQVSYEFNMREREVVG
uniref:Uncharacterized protein n=1 Tax=Anopheles culicifacies TaxID=139723 RepID=A0A182M1B1_9DIPT